MGDDNAYVSIFHTAKDYRKRGIGREVWSKCMEILGDRNVSLIATDYMVPVYKRWGYNVQIPQGVLLMDGKTTLPDYFQPDPDVMIQPITCKNFDDVMTFDKDVTLVDRKDAMKVFIFSPHTRLANYATENGKIQGYIMIRDGLKGIRLSAFYAENPMIAKELMYNAVSDVGLGVYWDGGFWKANIQECKPLYGLFGLTNVVEESQAFWNKHNVEFPYHKVFGVTEFFTTLY